MAALSYIVERAGAVCITPKPGLVREVVKSPCAGEWSTQSSCILILNNGTEIISPISSKTVKVRFGCILLTEVRIDDDLPLFMPRLIYCGCSMCSDSAVWTRYRVIYHCSTQLKHTSPLENTKWCIRMFFPYPSDWKLYLALVCKWHLAMHAHLYLGV